MDEFNVHMSGSGEYPDRIRMLVVGESGTGTTRLGASFPNPIFANSGSDLTTLARIGNVPYVNVSSIRDLYLLKIALDRPAKAREELFGMCIETLVIDRIEEMQRLVLLDRLASEGRSDTTAGDWGWIASRFHSIFTGLSQLDLNLLVLSRTKEVNLADDRVEIKPALGGAFCEGLHKYVDFSLLMTPYRVSSDESSLGEADLDDWLQPKLFEEEAETVPLMSLQCKASSSSGWVNDKTGTLPAELPVNDKIFATIQEYVKGVELVDSDTLVVKIPLEINDEQPDSPSETQVEKTLPDIKEEYICNGCSAIFTEKTWSDLSKMKFGKSYCKDCYKTKDR